MRIRFAFIAWLVLVSTASAQYTESPIAHLSRADGTFYVGAGDGKIVAETGATARLSLGLGTIATQNANSVAITGGTIDGTTIGGTTPGAGTFSTLSLGDAAKLQMGNSGVTDSYIDYTGSLLEMYAAGGIKALSDLTIQPSGAAGNFYIYSSGGNYLRWLAGSAEAQIHYKGFSSVRFNATNVNIDTVISGDNNFYLLYADAGTDRVGVCEDIPDYKLDVNGTFGFTPGTDSAPIDNGDVTVDFPTATTLRVRGKNGGTVRNLTLPISDSTALVASDQNAGTDITADLEEESHASEHAVGGADTVFPADPGSNQILIRSALNTLAFSTDLPAGTTLGTNTIAVTKAPTVQAGSGNTATLDWSANNKIVFTFDDNDAATTFTFTDPPAGSSCVLYLFQDGDGGESITWPAAETMYWAGDTGTPFQPDTTASRLSVVTLQFVNSVYVCTGYDYTQAP